MTKIDFIKMEGAGNDFIVIDDKKTNLKKLAQKACNRKTGIGADGLLVFCKSKNADYKMRIINADGSEAEMCGNGARCMAAYIARYKSKNKKNFSMETLAGTVLAQIYTNAIKVRLSNPKDCRMDIPLSVVGRNITVHYIDTGVPHAIVFVDSLQKIAVNEIGRAIRYHKRFKPRGTNVNFVEQTNENLVTVRTYERGVEHETQACGTGSVASAIIAYLKGHPNVQKTICASMKVLTASSEILHISFSLQGGILSNVWLKGSANFIAKGEYYV